MFVVFKLTLFAFLCSIPVVAFADGGGDSAGGGSTVRCERQKRAYLLDRLSLNPELADNPEVVTAQIAAPISSTKETGHVIGPLILDDGRAIELAIEKVSAWHAALSDKSGASPILLERILEAIKTTPFQRTKCTFNIIPRYSLPAKLQGKCTQIETGILYIPEYGAIISEQIWDPLDDDTKAGLLIHEAIRQVQGFENGYPEMTDEQLQLIAAQIMDNTPSPSFSFEPWMPSKMKLDYLRLRVWRAVTEKDCAICNQYFTSNGETFTVYAKRNMTILDAIAAALQAQQILRASELRFKTDIRQKLLNDLIVAGILKGSCKDSK